MMCLGVLKDPLTVCPSGHAACFSCALDLLMSGIQKERSCICPTCRTPLAISRGPPCLTDFIEKLSATIDKRAKMEKMYALKSYLRKRKSAPPELDAALTKLVNSVVLQVRSDFTLISSYAQDLDQFTTKNAFDEYIRIRHKILSKTQVGAHNSISGAHDISGARHPPTLSRTAYQITEVHIGKNVRSRVHSPFTPHPRNEKKLF